MIFTNIIKDLMPASQKIALKIMLSSILKIHNNCFKLSTFQKRLIVLSDGINPTFFGYHDKTPFSGDGTKILAMSISTNDRKPENECTPMRLGYFLKNENGKFENRFISFFETNTWCWQQGCMLQWHPIETNNKVIFNVLVDGSYGSIVYDIDHSVIIKKYNHPIYSVDPTGKFAITLNQSRIGRLRPGYGYRLLPDETLYSPAPESDGLAIFCLESGGKKNIVSLAELARQVDDTSCQHYINHASFSPDGRRIIFFHLWTIGCDNKKSMRVCEINVESGITHEVESERILSHYCWRCEGSFLATTLDKRGRWHYTIYDLFDKTRFDLDLSIGEDGHPMFHPLNKDIVVTDTYPDKWRNQSLWCMNIRTKAARKFIKVFSAIEYSKHVRCDLHPRWDREGKYVVFDNTVFGKRSMALIDFVHFSQ